MTVSKKGYIGPYGGGGGGSSTNVDAVARADAASKTGYKTTTVLLTDTPTDNKEFGRLADGTLVVSNAGGTAYEPITQTTVDKNGWYEVFPSSVDRIAKANGAVSAAFPITETPLSKLAVMDADTGTLYTPTIANPTTAAHWTPIGGNTEIYVNTTANTVVAAGDLLRVRPGDNLTIPVMSDGTVFWLAPLGGDWDPIWTGGGQINPDAAWTFGVGQDLPIGSSEILCVSNAATNNIELYYGGGNAAGGGGDGEAKGAYLGEWPGGTAYTANFVIPTQPITKTPPTGGIVVNANGTFTLPAGKQFEVECALESSAAGAVNCAIMRDIGIGSGPILGVQGTTDGAGYSSTPAQAVIIGPETIGVSRGITGTLGANNNYIKIVEV